MVCIFSVFPQVRWKNPGLELNCKGLVYIFWIDSNKHLSLTTLKVYFNGQIVKKLKKIRLKTNICHKCLKMKKREKNILNFENNSSTVQTIWCSFNKIWLNVLNRAFLSKCAEIKIDMHDKSMASDSNRPHFLLALSIKWERNRS